jgi:hypothetical protein
MATELTKLVRASGLAPGCGVERIHIGPGTGGEIVLTLHPCDGPPPAGPGTVPVAAEVLAAATCARIADGSTVSLSLATAGDRVTARVSEVQYLRAADREALYLDRAAAAAGVDVLASVRRSGVFTGQVRALIYVAAGPDPVRVVGLEDADALHPDRIVAWARLARDLGPAAFDSRAVTVEVGLTRGPGRQLVRP